MKRAGSTPSSRGRKHRVISPIKSDNDDKGIYHLIIKIMTKNPKHRAFHEERSPPPLTVSLGSGSSSDGQSEDDDADAATFDARGRRFFEDDYAVLKKVMGEGAYGKVCKCINCHTHCIYACKSMDKSRIHRFDHLWREVDLLSAMDHPNIIKMVGCYEDAKQVHIITEKYDGGELFDRIVENATSDGCLAKQSASRIIQSLLQAVDYLHENNIVHGDINPENIMFESKRDEAEIRLIDFGLSRKHMDGEAPMSNPVGTAYYMSPELLKGKYKRSTDMWLIGIVTYILLCSYPPFSDETNDDIFNTIRRGHFDFLTPAWSNKSNEAKDFIRCLLRRDLQKKFTAKKALLHSWIASSGKR
jgi:serine/threonine protein kinase